jgi:membrane protein implicated in regulation of membrane protease activity
MQAEHVGWFAPGSISLSFVFFAVAAVLMTSVVAGLVRYLSHRSPAHRH